MKTTAHAEAYFKFIVYITAAVLLNIVGMTLFFRIDLTENDLYSLSEASKEAVSGLSEPMTINVFFTENLPAPHNSTRRYLMDLLEEYAIHSNRYFNYRFYDVSAREEGGGGETTENRKLAENYGIHPVEIRMLEQDELKFKRAYMGLVIIHGDLIERIPAVTTTEGLEYRLTTAITKLKDKVSTLAGLPEKIDIRLYLSSSLQRIAAYIGVEELRRLPEAVEEAVDRLNGANFGKLRYEYIDPEETELDRLIDAYNLMSLKWPDIPGQNVAAGQGLIGLVMEYGGETARVQLLNVLRIPIIGTRYELVDMDLLEEIIGENVESLIGVNEGLGYLADHGTPGLFDPMMMRQEIEADRLRNFQALVSETYSFEQIRLAEDRVPESLNSMLIVKPTEPFSDYALYQIDQALMRGTSIAVFSDAFKEVPQPRQQMSFDMGPSYEPLETGLERLLSHYGLSIKKAYVMDKNCFRQTLPARSGGGEQPIYFAPVLEKENINNELDFMKNINGLVTINLSPLWLDTEAVSRNGLTAHRLLATSEQSWEMTGRINLNPLFIRPPQDEGEYRSYPIAYLLEGRFRSYFEGKEIPEKEKAAPDQENAGGAAGDTGDGVSAPAAGAGPSAVEARQEFIATGRPAKLLVVGSSALLEDNLIDPEGRSPNATFVLNVIDALNGRTDIAALRSKTQRFNPLDETSGEVKYAVKVFNIVGLPVLVVLFGLSVLWRRQARRRRIQMMFRNAR